jgi:DNA-binding NarL/FixJ family response regulator
VRSRLLEPFVEIVLAAGDVAAARAAADELTAMAADLDAPYEAARDRVAIARSCLATGDRAGATLELEAAREAFDRLGAVGDRAAVDSLLGTPPPTPGGLSPREVEVLVLVAHGGTNRGIAEELGISERTVDRHVSNIFTKLDVSSRAAATAFAYEHRLV